MSPINLTKAMKNALRHYVFKEYHPKEDNPYRCVGQSRVALIRRNLVSMKANKLTHRGHELAKELFSAEFKELQYKTGAETYE